MTFSDNEVLTLVVNYCCKSEMLLKRSDNRSLEGLKFNLDKSCGGILSSCNDLNHSKASKALALLGYYKPDEDDLS
jgi:hypothetical protein